MLPGQKNRLRKVKGRTGRSWCRTWASGSLKGPGCDPSLVLSLAFLPKSPLSFLQEAFPDCPPLDLAMLNLRTGGQFPEQGKNKGPEGCLGEEVGRSVAGSVCGVYVYVVGAQ